MTKEQETIERLKYLTIGLKSSKKVNEIITEEGKFNLVKDMETVLSMLKEKDKEIKTLTQTNKSYKGIINKKDRQIDLMARAFKQDDVRTVEEIKQYFERKSKEC